MGRRGSSAVDDLIGGASRLPWKVGAALALIAFVILHIVAEQSIPGSVAPHPPVMGAVVLRGYVHVFATVLQFIHPRSSPDWRRRFLLQSTAINSTIETYVSG